MFKDTMASDWKKNPTIGKAVGALAEANTPPETVGKNIYGASSQTPAPMQSLAPGELARKSLSGANQFDVKPAVLGATSRQMPSPVSAPQQFSYTRGGVNVTADEKGNRTFTQGTPGTDGSARAFVPAQQPATISRQQLGGDAAARFNAPVAPPADRGYIGRMIQAVSTSDYLPKEQPATSGLIGKESGMGWKSRLALNSKIIEGQSDIARNKSAEGMAALREYGETSRALLQDKRASESNEILRDRVAGEQAVQAVDIEGKKADLAFGKQTQSLRDKLLQTSDPTERRNITSQLLAISGKPDNQKFQIVSKKGVGDDGVTPTETNYAVNPEDPTQSFEIGPQKAPTAAPEQAIEYLKKNPQSAQLFKQKYGYLPKGF